ncbi:ATP-binding protein [Shewanella algae]|uniref:ATP-binding protein n=1 Tax=Shewanella algae TaxID=38313 RepID=UPI001181EA14|nr:ATP-binding protein [Shewanella algae]MBO2583796.1 two-component sensor histidine kinase [Shewanella algae]TVL44815.1 two-component sensor histidine kinase [Shewanella algae]BCV55219.1 two-component sensor histidine kinase [Shewanella algae]
MKFQFYRLFGFLLLSCSLLLWSFGQLTDQYRSEEASYLISVDDLLQTRGQGAHLSTLAAGSLALPTSLRQLLNEGQTLALRHSSGELYYYKQVSGSELLRFGPVTEKQDREDVTSLILLGFYSSLALVAILLIWPVFRDLHTLQQSAIRFGRQPSLQPLTIRKSSAIFPLAQALYSMSHQIVSFVQMHKELSHTISHEVRTPLARMRFALELSKQQMEPQYAARLAQDIDEIEQLAANYLSFARLEHKQGELCHSPQSIADFMQTLEQKYSLYSRDFQIGFHSVPGQAQFDKTAMNVACQNLIQNAMRFAEKEIQVSFEQSESHNCLRVEDDGPGFEDKGKKLLAAFARDAKQSDGSGFGLGLYIVRKIAIWHGGRLELSHSQTLGGAAISLCWPRE